jgi:hypothetical protein
MTEYKEYHAVYTNGSVTTKMLRETKNYLIEQDGTKYRKSTYAGDEHLAERMNRGGWTTSGYRIYVPNHPFALKKIKEQEEKYFTTKVCNIMSQKARRLTYDEAVKINEVLGFGVEE